MTNQRSPDGRLVYLHCSAIFSGQDAYVRKAKKILQLLKKHRASIQILEKEFTLAAIAVVAKELLEERIFESLPQAKLRYPELFQPSGSQEAEREASEAEVIRIESEAAEDIVLTSDDDGGDECPNFEQGEQQARLVEDKPEAAVNAVKLCEQSTSLVHHVPCIPKLHPVYLPFKTQHRTLVLVQSLLEECCVDFGNQWVPDLMKAQRWDEAESVELTQWTKRFRAHAKSLPRSALKSVPGKSVAQVLSGTSTLRHSAVHRLQTSAAGILNMLNAAVTFAEALQDSKRAEKIAEIRTQLEASIDEIIQHQNLLERKLTDQYDDIARQRAELDELERSSIEEMLANDKKQRSEIGSALENFLVGLQRASSPCTCGHTPSIGGTKADSKAEENFESSWTEDQSKTPTGVNEAQNYDQSSPSEEKPHRGEIREKYSRFSYHSDSTGSPEEKSRVANKRGYLLRSMAKKKKGKIARGSSWCLPAAEESLVLADEAFAPEDAPAPAAEDVPALAPEDVFVTAIEDTPALDAEDASVLAPEDASALAPEDAPALAPEDAPALAPEDAPAPALEDASMLALEDTPALEDASVLAPEDAPAPALEDASALAPGDAPALAPEDAPAPASEYDPRSPAHVTDTMGWEWPQSGAWDVIPTGSVAPEPHNAVEEAIPDAEPCSAAATEAFPTDELYIAPVEEEPLPEDTFPTAEAISDKDLREREEPAPEATMEISQADPIIEGFDSVEESSNLGDPIELTQELNIAPMHSAPAEITEFLVPPSRPALSAGHDKINLHPPPLPTPSSRATSILEAAAAEAPTKDSHTITLKIHTGSRILRSVVYIKACTRTAILNEARAYCINCGQDDQGIGGLLLKGWDLVLMSLKMYGYDMDLSTYKVENLSSLVRTVEKTEIPSFTLRISEI